MGLTLSLAGSWGSLFFYDVSRQIRPQLITFKFNLSKLYIILISRKFTIILRLFCYIWVLCTEFGARKAEHNKMFKVLLVFPTLLRQDNYILVSITLYHAKAYYFRNQTLFILSNYLYCNHSYAFCCNFFFKKPVTFGWKQWEIWPQTKKRDLTNHNNLYEIKTTLCGGPLRFLIWIGSERTNSYVCQRRLFGLPSSVFMLEHFVSSFKDLDYSVM